MLKMNAYLNAYASQHLQFCEKFITDKTMPLPSPKIDTELSSVHDRNSLKNIRIPLPMEPIQRLSKLVIYKTKVQKALTNNRDSKEEKYIVNRFGTIKTQKFVYFSTFFSFFSPNSLLFSQKSQNKWETNRISASVRKKQAAMGFPYFSHDSFFLILHSFIAALRIKFYWW